MLSCGKYSIFQATRHEVRKDTSFIMRSLILRKFPLVQPTHVVSKSLHTRCRNYLREDGIAHPGYSGELKGVGNFPRPSINELPPFRIQPSMHPTIVMEQHSHTFPIFNPSTGVVLCYVPDFDVDRVQNTIDRSEHAFLTWKKKTARERCHILRKWADLLIHNIGWVLFMIILSVTVVEIIMEKKQH